MLPNLWTATRTVRHLMPFIKSLNLPWASSSMYLLTAKHNTRCRMCMPREQAAVLQPFSAPHQQHPPAVRKNRLNLQLI